ncbi:MAG TPA: hypothetical protein VFM46_11410 [Pseudomonadales bacterium]|nr:hypothetical protein [Pseudomonadales bacterium]
MKRLSLAVSLMLISFCAEAGIVKNADWDSLFKAEKVNGVFVLCKNSNLAITKEAELPLRKTIPTRIMKLAGAI